MKLYDDKLAITNLMMYLGVKLDRNLCFKEHVVHVIIKAEMFIDDESPGSC